MLEFIPPRAALAAVLGFVLASPLHAGVVASVTATQDDGVAAGSHVAPGSTLTYSVTLRNPAATDVTGVTLTDPAPLNTTDVPNTLTATPVAVDDVYPQTVMANMSVNTATSGFSVVSNDFKGFAGGNPVALSAISVALAGGPAHGTVSLTASGAGVGTFTYTPTAGYVGADSFTYTISNGVAGGDVLSTTGTLNLTVGGPVIWFVNAASGDDVLGDGSLAKPFKTLTKVAGVDGAGQAIFMYSGTYSTGLTLETGEALVGQGASGSFDAVMGIAPGTDSPARPALAGANPVITGGIVLGSNNSLNGFTCGNFVGTSIAGTTFGTLAVTSVTINNATGAALNLSGGTVSGSGFSSVTSGAGTNNVALTNIAGTLALGGGALSGASADAFVVNTGTGSINYSGTITNSSAKAVVISSKTGGTVTLSGNVGSSGTGINLAGNTGATINFSGTLTVSTGANTAFSATGGGTVSASDANSTLSTTTATALNVVGTTIGTSGLKFLSINSGAGASDGIVLDTTGASGGLSVTGSGSGSAGSGGTISGKTGSDGTTTSGIGIYLNNTSKVSLAYMSLQGNQNYGIRGNNVTGFTLDHCAVGTSSANGSSNTADLDATSFQGEGGVRFYNLLGTATISNSTLDNGFSRTLAVSNDTGTLTNLTLSNSTLSNSLTAITASDAMYLQAQGAGTIANLTVTGGCQFTAARQAAIQTNAKAGATMNLAIDGSSFKNTNTNPVNASNLLVFNGSGTNTWVTFALNNNSLTQGNGLTSAPANAGRILTAGMVSGAGTFYGKITNNIFGVSGIANSAGGGGADAIGLFATGNNGSVGGSRFLVQGNTIQNYGLSGIQIGAVDGSATLDATVVGNTIRQPGTIAQGAFAGVWAYAGDQPTDTNILNIAIGSTTLAAKNTLLNSDPNNLTDVFLGSAAVASATQNLFKNGSASATANAVLTDDNIGPLDLSGNIVGTVVLQTGTPSQPPLLLAAGGIARAAAPAGQAAGEMNEEAAGRMPAPPVARASSPEPSATKSCSDLTELSATPSFSAPNFEHAAVKPAPAASPERLSQTDLDSAAAAAIERWQATGLTPAQVAVLRQLRFETADLPGIRLGEAAGNLIRVSRNAGGNGWFTDASAASDAMFAEVKAPTLRYTTPVGAPAGRMDLLTAILHEMGHALGLDDTYAMADRGSLMYGQLTMGERRLPAKRQAAAAEPAVNAEPHFLTAAVTIPTLPAGKSVHLSYQVHINDPVTVGATQISSQGSVSVNGFSDVLTDDPETGALGDATVTLLAIPPALIGQPADTMVIAGQPASFTASASGAPAPTVQWQESSNGVVFADIIGAVAGTYTFTPTLAQTGHQFRAVFTNIAGGATSNAATLTVVTPPALATAFGAATIPLNGSTSLTFTITNANAATALSGVAFTDTLPAGLVVATPNGQSGALGGGSLSAVAGSGTVSLSGATVPAAGSIQFSVNVTASTAGVKNNSVLVNSTQGGAGNTSNASLTVVAPPVITQALGVSSMPLNGSTSLTFTVQNNNTTTTLTGIGFAETLPAGLVVATPNGQFGTAGGGTITAIAGSNTITVAGASLAQSSGFTFSINVTGATAGIKNLSTGAVSSNEGGNGSAGLASIHVVAPPLIAQAFGAANVALNGTTSLTFTITNPAANADALTGVAFSNSLPSGLVVATPNGLSNTAGGTATAVAGSGTISLTGGTIAVGASATVVVNVTGTTGGVKNNTTTPVSSTNGGTGTPASASLTVASPATLVMAFGAASVPLNGSTSLTYTITNPNNLALTGVAFTNSLPAGLVVATPNGLTSTAGGTATAVAGSGTVSLAAATIAANASVTVSLNVTGATAGVKNNSVVVTSTEAGTGNTSSASLTVVAPPVIFQALGAASIPLNGSTSLTFTVQNNNTTTTLTGIGFTETLPAGLVVATPSGLVGSAGGGTITAIAGSNTITVAGASLAQSSSFTFSINVTGAAAGIKNLSTGAVSSNEGGTGGTASASIQVVAPPFIAAAFGAANVALNGTTSLTFTLTNPAANAVALTGVAFTNTLPAGLVVATPNGLSSTAGGTATAVAGSGSISLTGGTLAAGASATVVVNVTGTTSGVKNNTTTPVSSANGGTGNTASALLTVASPASIVMAFGAATVPLNGSTSVTYTITNPNAIALTGVAFTNNLPAGLVVATPNGLTSTAGGTATATAGAGTVSLSGGTVAANASVSISLNVTGTTAGVKNNSVQVTSTEAGPGNTSNASITVVAPPVIFQALGAASIPLNGSTSLTFTVQNTNTTATLTGIGFTETLPAGMVVATPNGQVGTPDGGTLTAVAGSNTISVSSASLAQSSSFTFSINVTGTAAGNKNLTTGNVTSTEGGTGGTASASLSVVAPPVIAAAFGATDVFTNGTTSLTFTLTNPAANAVALTGVAFTDTLPAGLVIATPNGLTNTAGGTAIAVAGSGSISLTGGSLAAGASATLVVNVKAITAGVQVNTTTPVTSTNGGTGNSATATLNVHPPVDHFAVSAPASATAGTAIIVTVTAQDIANAIVPGYTGSVHFTSSDATAVLPADATLTNGTGTFAVTLKTSGNQTVSVNDTTTVTLTGTSAPILVSAAAADHLAFTQQPSNTTAGSSVSPAVTVRIVDVFNNIVLTNTSSVILALGNNPGSGTLSGTKTVAAVSGVATFSGLSINKTGAGYTLVASDAALTGATSGPFSITPAAASVVVFTGVPASTTAGVSISFVLTAWDPFGNVATGYTGTQHFTSTDAAATLPANYTFTAADSGTHTFAATLQTVGSKTLTATDTVTSSITGTSSAVAVAELISIAATDANAAVTGGDTGTYRFTRSGNGGNFTVNFQLDAASTATATDFTLSGGSVSFNSGTGAGTVTFPNGSTTVDLTLTAVASASGVAKPATTVQLDVASGSGYATILPNQATVTIAQNGFVVVNTNDAGSGSLRQAILNANALPGTDTITFAGATFTDASVPDVITLTSGELVINSPLNIMGLGANVLHISANHAGRVFNLTAGSYNVRLDGLTIRDGAVTDQFGAGIQSATSGTLAITRCVIRDNQITDTDAIHEQGAGIYQTSGQLIIRDSTISTNTASRCLGGGLAINNAASLQLINSTVSGNQANQGAGIWVNAGCNASIAQATVSANVATSFGGGIYTEGTVTLANSLVAGNVASIGLDLCCGKPPAAVSSLGGNLIGNNDASSLPAGLPNASGDFVGTAAAPLNPVLGPLANNGGPTPTHALLNGSPAINIGRNSNIPTDAFDQNGNSNTTEPIPFDQRGSGFARLIGPAVDSGAFEAFAFKPTITTTSTDEDVLSSGGLVISANAADGGLTAYFKITNILNGTLYQNDGVTVITAGSFIAKAQGAAGLRFLAAANLNSANTAAGFGFSAQAAVGNTDADLRDTASTVSINVNPVNDPPTVVAPGIADQTILVGQNLALALLPSFTDIEGDTLTFSVTSNTNPAAASAVINGTQVALHGLASGVTHVTVQADDGHGGTVSDTFTVAVGTAKPTALQVGTGGTLNRQSGLFELTVNVTNTMAFPINGFRLHVNFNAYLAAYPSLRLYNATSPAGNADAYVDYPYPVALNALVPVKLTFYTSTRTFPAPFAPVLTVETLAVSQVPDTNGNGVQATFVMLPDHTNLLEFPSIIGHWYRVRYSPDMVHWSDCPVPLQAGTTRMQWTDTGPPFTNVPPANAPSRFYIVNEITAP